MTGEIDLATAPRLRDAISEAFERSAERRLVVDLTDVDFLACAGLNELLSGDSQARRHGGRLRIVIGDNPSVRRTIKITGLDKVLALYPLVTTAITAG